MNFDMHLKTRAVCLTLLYSESVKKRKLVVMKVRCENNVDEIFVKAYSPVFVTRATCVTKNRRH